MQAHLIQIGNSMGIRIPKHLIKECDLEGDVELLGVRGTLVVRPVSTVRHGWDKAFADMAKHGDDRLIDAVSRQETAWDRSEWRW